MSRPVTTALALTFVILAASPRPASAAGWTGGDHYLLRKAFSRGFTLKPLWDRLSER